MSTAVCFRCDWEGNTRQDACPRCGARLYREARAKRTKLQATSRGRGRSGERSPGPTGPTTDRDMPEPARGSRPPSGSTSRRSSAPVRVLAGMAAAAIVLGLLWTRLPRPAASRPIRGPSSSKSASPGILVYAAPAPGTPGQNVLWYLDLSTGRALPGPTVPAPIELVDASLAGPGWVGLTAVGPRGKLVAYIVKGTLLSDVPVRLGSGDLIAWGPRGKDVAIAREGPVAGGCRRVSIDVVGLDGSTARVLDRRSLCGNILSLGRDGAFTYFTRLAAGRAAIYSFGLGLTRAVLAGREFLSVSPASDLLVVAPAAFRRQRRPASGLAPDVLAGPLRAVTYRRASGAGRPASFRRAGLALEGDRVLAWSPDSSRAAVVGSLGREHGIFLLNTGLGQTRRVPVLMVRGRVGLGAAFSPAGAAYLAAGGHLYRYTEWLSNVVLPTGGPPTGPMAWLP